MAETEEAPAQPAKAEERPKKAPQGAAPKPAPPAHMPYLGTLSPADLARTPKKRGPASLPVVVKGAGKDGKILGVVVAANPGFLGKHLEAMLADAGHKGPFEELSPSRLDGPGRLSAARAIARAPAEGNEALDKESALASFGYTLKMTR